MARGEYVQLNLFDPPDKSRAAPRVSWEGYGISKKRYRELRSLIRSGEYPLIAAYSAQTANKIIAEYILLSVTKKLSYDAIRVKWELREIERMPCGRTDFYGYRRLFYHICDMEFREIGL